MSLTRIDQNITSINAQRNLEHNSAHIGRSIERLASGLRINRGADDPAGLVISELLRAQVSGLNVAEQNASQGVNLIKTAEGALKEVSGLLRQMRDLAVDAVSDSNKNADARAALQSQVESALTTIDEIAVNTKYAGRSLLDGTAGASRSILDLGTTSALSDIDVSTVVGAEAALTIIDEVINALSAIRGGLDAFQVNGLEAEARSLAVAHANLSASESQIRDTDFGREMAEFTTSQVLVPSATAFLPQANSLP